MALLQRFRVNSQFGVLDTEADATTQTLSSPEFASLPVVGAGQILPLILDPEKEDGAAEIVHVTAHASGATTVTVERGQEGGSPGRIHPTGTTWRHGPTTFDFGNGHKSLADNNAAYGNGAMVDDAVTNATAVGANARATKSHQMALGDARVVVTLAGIEVAVRLFTVPASVSYNVLVDYDDVANVETRDRVLLIDTGACDSTTVTLPPAASNEGRIITIKKVDDTLNPLTIDGNGTETIDGAATQVLSAQYEDITMVCDGTAWFIIG